MKGNDFMNICSAFLVLALTSSPMPSPNFNSWIAPEISDTIVNCVIKGEYQQHLDFNGDNFLTIADAVGVAKRYDDNVKYGPYTVDETGKYKMYFSEENSWDGSNVYIAATAKTFYITNNKKWTDTIYVYVWNSSTSEYAKSWPGIEATYVETNSYGEAIYKVEVDVTKYDMMIISHGTIKADGSYTLSSQTIDLVIADYSKNGFYFTDKNTDKKYQVGTWNK